MMKVGLVVNRIESDFEDNFERIQQQINFAVSLGCKLVLFPEACITGLINNDDVSHDLSLGLTLQDEKLGKLREIAKEFKIDIAIGILEREGNKLYDSMLYLSNNGEIKHHYRRISKGWHGRNVNPDIYREGVDLKAFDTSFGKMSILICGDLFDENLVNKVRDLHPEVLLVPIARSYYENSITQEIFDQEELPEYRDQVHKVGVKTLMVNYMDAYCFGGAWVFSNEGNVIHQYPIHQEGILIVDL